MSTKNNFDVSIFWTIPRKRMKKDQFCKWHKLSNDYLLTYQLYLSNLYITLIIPLYVMTRPCIPKWRDPCTIRNPSSSLMSKKCRKNRIFWKEVFLEWCLNFSAGSSRINELAICDSIDMIAKLRRSRPSGLRTKHFSIFSFECIMNRTQIIFNSKW